MQKQTNTKPTIYTVTQVNSLVKNVLDAHLPASLVVRGEISGWKRHQRGHCYFSLKDEDSVLPCVMWSSDFSRTRFKPEDGMAVLATGNIGVNIGIAAPMAYFPFCGQKASFFGSLHGFARVHSDANCFGVE